ncbi:oligopeptidase A [Alcanivorax jadensis T9]|jgi:oligopeptidase A|uniref:oligopeptidase A n=1 Tax=Alcanivorax jadensis T9 TaxID=1177181 RepID=A0ABR4W9Q8_9GAMM|nr:MULTISPECIES: oligopeptidase A [Alcanivorax]KGD60113.1 oligopeptidase A [Alcanivorax jadensis T9]MAC13949.1 oligopeptidase A [Alcanivorax sp.]MAC14569.1 oligopeptidase A [Alcanivorax sp.]MBP22110.1 oligopeptidase A [Alcanivorax sp.]|tara:strand:- start:6992 stop:9025 length:2034 start_codon:yes stop_codon:yes gene_type:complete
MSNNPLIDYPELPPFSKIQPEHVLPAVEQLVADGRARIQQVLAEGKFDYAHLVQALDEEDDRLGKAFGPAGHLNAVAQNEALRNAYNSCLPLLSEYGTEVGQNAQLCAAYQALRDSDEWSSLSEAQQKDIENTLRDFRLSGVDLPDDKKAQYMANSKRLSELTSQFSDNTLDATQAWTKHISDEAELDGLPDSAKAGAADRAKADGKDGWLLTLDAPVFIAVMSHCKNAELRKEMYVAWTTKASDQGPQAGQFDNTAIMDEILKLRHEQAQLLGFANFGEESLATKMARDVNEVIQFLEDLAKRAKPQAEQELAALRAFAAEKGADDLNPWDIGFWSERLREERYSISEEELRPWFPADTVINGMFAVVGKLFGIQFRQRDDVDLWHEDARFYELVDDDGSVRAAFYLDMYARTGKRGGAWMDDARIRRRRPDGSLQTPVAYLTCNFAPPAGGKPGLLTHDEVVTLFHEFGHGLHHMLTEQDVSGISGINGVAWDAVELPSQFLENWCWTEEGIALISGHYETGEPLPKEKLEKMLAAKNFQGAMQMVRQLEFSLFDMRIHAEYQEGLDIYQVLNEVREQVSVIQPPAFNRFPNSFGHIFAGGYAAGYYSYKWAEVLSADAYSRFEEEGEFNEDTGRAFRSEILAKGGSREPMELFKAFRGREPSVEPLLRHCGING